MKLNKEEFFTLFDKLISQNIEGCLVTGLMTIEEAKTLLDYDSDITLNHNPKTEELVFTFNKNNC
ncbi:MAG: hypothetical protein M0P71_18125 [Melioribacteraceae bacterium]|nr:hypothetical protein [Melioribacteraceae bacterium]